MTPLEHALAYAARGWRVAPIPPGHKYPHGIDRWQELATTDAGRITRYWTANADHGVCIATGAESGVWALDVDPDAGGDDSLAALVAAHGELPDTVQSLTGGGGAHHLFAWPDVGEIRNSASGVLGVGLDVRGAGGQIVVAPSAHGTLDCKRCAAGADCPRLAYAWEIEHDPLDGIAVARAPDWLLEALAHEPGTAEPRRPPRPRPIGDLLPGDWWASRTSWPDELTRRHWSLHSSHASAGGEPYELWTRPGKDVRAGASASLYWQGSDVLKVFSTDAAPLAPESTYTLWGFEVAHAHGGDFAAGAKAVRSSMNGHASGQLDSTSELENQQGGGDDNGGRDSTTDVAKPKPPQRPAIVHNGRQLDDVVAAAVAALAGANHPEHLFVRAGALARVRADEEARPIVDSMRAEHVRIELAAAATWWRALKDGERTATSPPLDIAISVTAAGHWPLPGLAGVVELPVLRPDGTFVTDHGYDAATKLYHWHRGAAYPAVPDQPSAEQLAEAVRFVDEAICDFPWDTSADRANAWGLLLTPLVRPVVGQVPMALIDAPEPGTGKGLLVTVAATITLGRPAGLMAWPTTEEELEKKIAAALMGGATMVIFDNVEGMIRSGTLAGVLTADVWQGRVLGRSENFLVPNKATWMATGNNIDVGGDLARRCYRIRLDARQARPWKRTGFRHPDLAQWTVEHRGELLHALCTIVRSWWAAGRPLATDVAAMGGYTTWVRVVGGILAHAGIGDFLANLAEFHATADREAQAWEAFLTAWSERLGEQPVTIAELIGKMADIYYGGTLRDVIPEDLAGYWDTPSFSRRLGHALRKRTGRHYGEDGLHLVEMPRDRRQVAIYTVTSRTIELFPDDSAAGCAPHPARADSATRDDATNAGSAGCVATLRVENSYPQDIKGYGDPATSRTSSHPADDPAADMFGDG